MQDNSLQWKLKEIIVQYENKYKTYINLSGNWKKDVIRMFHSRSCDWQHSKSDK